MTGYLTEIKRESSPLIFSCLWYSIAMSRNNPFQGSVWEALQQCPEQNNSDIQLWQQTAFLATLENTDNAKKSIAVLKKHLPKAYHPLIRFAQPKHRWYLNVEKSVTAHRLNWLLDDLSLRIAKDIGYAPQIQVAVKAAEWSLSGFPLSAFETIIQPCPTKEEADQFIADFLSNKTQVTK